MTRFTGGFIRSNEFTSNRFGIVSGMFTLGQQLGLNALGTWPSDYDVILQFNESGKWECPPGVTQISEYLLIGGGGGGGGGSHPISNAAGGGGAGAFKMGTGIPVIAGKTYDMSVGGGGVGGTGQPASTVANTRGGNGVPTGLVTEANVRYYVSVGNPGAGNKYYVKTEQNDDAASNLTPELKLYEGSTYVFDQSHPTNAPNHPLRFASDGAPSFTPYTTGVTTNQPSVGVGTPGSGVMIVVSDSAPNLHYYCTVHGAMGNQIETLSNVTTLGNGGGGGGASARAPISEDINDGHKGGSGGGAGGVSDIQDGGGILVPGEGNVGGQNVLAGNYGAGGGGGAGGAGETATGTGSGNTPAGKAGDGGVGQIGTPFTPLTIAGGGGGGSYGNTGTAPHFHGIGKNGGGDGAVHPDDSSATAGTVNTGGGGGGSARGGPGKAGGSGLMFIKYKNKINNKVFKFRGSAVWKNNFNAKTIDYLVVAGGGGGSNYYGGGGGAGGTRIGTLDVSNTLNDINISVGAGGSFGNLPNPGPWLGGNGTGSSLQFGASKITSNGGGGGGRYDGDPSVGVQIRSAAHSGGCGGGFGFQVGSPGFPGGPDGVGTMTFGRTFLLNSSNGHSYPLPATGENTFRGTAIQGSDGGVGFHSPGNYAMSGGGGGATQRGGNGVYTTPGLQGGNGGDGIVFNGEFYAGGGGGICNDKSGVSDPGNSPFNYVPLKGLGGNGGGGNGAFYPGVNFSESGTAFTGGGGGGAQQQDPSVAGAGGSGIVVIKITG